MIRAVNPGLDEAQFRQVLLAFAGKYSREDAIEEIAALAEGQPELVPFLESLRSSERGLSR